MEHELTKTNHAKIIKRMHIKASRKRPLKERENDEHNESLLRAEGYDDFVNDFTQWFDDLKAEINKSYEFDGEEPHTFDFPLDDYYFGIDEEDERPVPTLAIDGTLYDILVYGWQYGSNEWYPIMDKNSMGKRWDELIQKYSGELYRAGLWYFYDVGYETLDK